jgi:WhiB family redox-sensing transcriptional regulator
MSNRNPRPGVVAAGSSPSGGTAWRLDAACDGADLSLFFGEWDEEPSQRRAREAQAKAVCAGCPSRVPCLEFAVALAIPWGVFGGLSEDERRSLKGPRQIRRLCGNDLHVMDEANTYHSPQGWDVCRACRAALDKRYRQARREAERKAA